jgi:predicted amidohydrolase
MTQATRPQALRVAMAQMRVEGGQAEPNLQRAVAFIEQAAQAGCHLVVLPECLDLGWGDTSARTLAQPIPGPHSARLGAAAQTHGVAVAAGLVERSGTQLFNAALLIDAEGRTLLHHRKIHELHAVVDGLYTPGERLAVARLVLAGREWVVGLNICADNAPDNDPHSLALGHALGLMGAQLIVSPCAWAVPPDHDNAATPYGLLWRGSYGALARAHQLAVVGVSSVGQLRHGAWAGWPVIGASLAVGSDGAPIGQAPFGAEAEGLTVIELQHSAVSQTRSLSESEAPA